MSFDSGSERAPDSAEPLPSPVDAIPAGRVVPSLNTAPPPALHPTLHPIHQARLAAMTTAIAHASSLDGELQALATGQEARNVMITLASWGLTGAGALSLTALASVYGVARERIRQIVRRHEARLTEWRPVVPRAAHAVAVLEAAGGVLAMEEWLERCAADGLEVSATALAALPRIGSLQLVPALAFDPRYRLFLTHTAQTGVLAGGWLGRDLKQAQTIARLLFSQTGVVPLERLQHIAPFGVPHLLELLARTSAEAARQAARLTLETAPPDWNEPGRWFTTVRGADAASYVLERAPDDAPPAVRPVMTSKLTDRVLWMLAHLPAAAATLSIEEVRAGLQSSLDTHLTIPAAALTLALARDPRFAVDTDATTGASTVRATGPLDRAELLTASERVVVDTIEAAGGVASYGAIAQALEAAQYSRGSRGWLIRTPAIVQLARGRYGIRGAPGIPAMLVRDVQPKSGPGSGVWRQAHEQNGRWMLTLAVPDTARWQTIFRLPSGLAVPDGIYQGVLPTAEGSPRRRPTPARSTPAIGARIRILGRRVSGLCTLIAQAGGDAGAVVDLALDVATRTVQVLQVVPAVRPDGYDDDERDERTAVHRTAP